MSDTIYDVAVVGAGGAGTMAFLRAVLNFDRAVLFSGDSATKRRGRATWVFEVDNIPGMHDAKKPITNTTATTLKWIEAQPNLAAKATHVKSMVSAIERLPDDAPQGPGFALVSEKKGEQQRHYARFVVLATGIMDVQPHIGGSIEPILPFANRGDVLYCLRCDGHKAIGQRLSIIGSGTTALSIANLMHERYQLPAIKVLPHDGAVEQSGELWELSASYGVQVCEGEIVEVLGDAKRGSGLEGFRLADGTVVESNRCIVSLGTIVYNDLLKALGGELAADGRVIVQADYETSVPGLFAVGDLVAGKKMQIYTGWDEAVDAADAINRRLRKLRRDGVIARA